MKHRKLLLLGSRGHSARRRGIRNVAAISPSSLPAHSCRSTSSWDMLSSAMPSNSGHGAPRKSMPKAPVPAVRSVTGLGDAESDSLEPDAS